MNYIELTNQEMLLLYLIVEDVAKSEKCKGVHKIDLDSIRDKIKQSILRADETENLDN